MSESLDFEAFEVWRMSPLRTLCLLMLRWTYILTLFGTVLSSEMELNENR